MPSQFSLPLDPAVVQSVGQQSGLTVSTVGTLGTPLLITDPSFIQANNALVKANAAFVQANTTAVKTQAVYDYANTLTLGAAIDAFARANTASLLNVNNLQNTTISIIQSVDISQNAAISATDGKMQFSYDQANTGTVLAQAAFNSANNVSPQIQPAFNQANTGTVLAQASYNAANASFLDVNTAITIIQGINVTQNTAIAATDGKMASAYDQSNTGSVLAQAAFNYANTISSSNTSIDSFARTTANTGSVLAQAAFNQANTATAITNISGNAGTANTAITATYLNAAGSSASAANIAGTNRINSGFWQNSAPTTETGWPVNSSWYHLHTTTHSNEANYYSMQLSADFYSQALYYRSTNGSGNTAWSKVILDTNYNSYAPKLDGTGATGIWGINVSGSAGSVANTGIVGNLSANTVTTGNFTISESGGKLIFKYGSTVIASMSANGMFISANNVIAGGTP